MLFVEENNSYSLGIASDTALNHSDNLLPPTAAPNITTTVINLFDSSSDCCCYSCGEKMASVPYTLQMTKAAKKNKKATNKGMKQDQFYDSCMGGENPTRYSSKMMNSIWGQYNELSVHNFKSLQCGGVASAPQVQETQNLNQQLQSEAAEPGPDNRSGYQKFFGELGQAVTKNFMDNMHQY